MGGAERWVDASAVEINLPKETGISATFTDQPDTQYNARVGIRVEARERFVDGRVIEGNTK